MRFTRLLPLALTLTGAATAQTALQCIANAAVPPTVRASGQTEMIGDVTLFCTGGTPTPTGAAVPLYNLRVRAQSLLLNYDSSFNLISSAFSPVNITSRQLAPDGSSEALLSFEDPHSPRNPTVPLLVCGDANAPATTAGVCNITGNGTGLNIYAGTSNRPNVFQGKLVGADTLEWANIPFDPPGPGTQRMLRIANIRMNASQAPLSTGSMPTVLVLTPTLTAPTGVVPLPSGLINQFDLAGGQAVAFIQQGFTVQSNSPSAAVSLPQCQAMNSSLLTNPASSPATYTVWVRIKEMFQSAMKRKNIATNGVSATAPPASGDQNQNVTGGLYTAFAEAGFENLGPTRDPSPNPPVGVGFSSGFAVPATPAFPAAQGLINAGVADSGTRFALLFHSVPSGVALFVPTTISLTNQVTSSVTGQAVLVSTDANGAGIFSAVTGTGGSISNFGTTTSGLAQVAIGNGSGTAVYEVIYADPLNPEQIDVPVALSYAAGAPATGVTATVTVTTAPIGGAAAADATSSIPRFTAGIDGVSAQPLFSFAPCGASRMTLTASSNTFFPSDTINYTATVSPAPAAAGGVVAFTVDRLPWATALLGADGTAVLPAMINGVGPHDVTATYTTPGPGSRTVSATTQVFVSPSLLSAVASTSDQVVPINSAFSPLMATVVNKSQQPRNGASVTFTAPANGASGTFSNGTNTITLITNGSGLVSAPFTANGTAGRYPVLASGDSGSAIFYLVNTLAPASITALAGSTPQSAATNTNFGLPIGVTVRDALGAPVSGVPVTFSAPSTGASGALALTRVFTNGSGVASSSIQANSMAGTYTVTATVTPVVSPATFTLTNFAGPPVITSSPLDQIVQVGTNVSLLAAAIDATTPAVRWQVSTVTSPTFIDIAGATSTVLTLQGVTYAMNGNQYRAVFSNSIGSAITLPATLRVAQLQPVITWANPADISSGTALSAVQLNAATGIPGTFVYTPAAGTVLPAGNAQQLSVTFTATDAATYAPVSKTVFINVLPGGPTVVSLTPAASGGSTRSFAVQFSHSSGVSNLTVLNLLINTALDGRLGCYLAYVQQSNTVYLVNDAGDAGGPYAGSLVLNGSGSIRNSQCTILGAGSAVTTSGGNTLGLTLNISFSAGFAGNKVVFAAARDASQNNTGWQTIGVQGVPPLAATFPNAISISPASGAGATNTMTLTYADASSASNLQTVWALINTALDGRAGCYLAYYRPGNQLFLVPDNGDGSQATKMVLNGGANSLSNSQCTVSEFGSFITTSGGQLTLTLNVSYKTSFTGAKGVWMAAQTLGGQVSPWQALGVWRVLAGLGP